MRRRTPVLIVGAGPCGLAAACALRMRGVEVRLVDAGADPATGSRALQLWPPALDVLAELGVLEEAERRGPRVKEMIYHLAGGRGLRVRLGRPNEPLLLPQEQTNGLLEERLGQLGGTVERSVTVIGVAVTEDGVIVKAQDADGEIQLIEADWLVAADGVRSTLRDALGIDFPGSPVRSPFLIAEGSFGGDYAPGDVHYYFGRTGSLVFAPMNNGLARAGFPVSDDFEPSAQAVQELLDERGAAGLRLTELTAISKFASQERIAVRFQQGRCFLVGDAAHTHAAVGGQGLNLGLQDIRNLAWKLAGVLDGRLSRCVLASYETERRSAAEQIVHNTQQFVRMFTLPPWAAVARNAVWRGLESTGVLRRWFAPLIAGRRIRYPQSLYGADPPGGVARAVALRAARLARPGERTPHHLAGPAAGPRDVFQLCTSGAEDGELAVRASRIAAERPDLVVHGRLPGGPAKGFMLLRPDGYVAASGTTRRELAHVHRLLDAITARAHQEA